MKTPIKKLFYFFVIVLMLNTACHKEEKTNLLPSPSNSSYQKIAGRVVDENGNPVIGATVNSNGKTAITGSFGQFNLTNVNVINKRVVVKCDHIGYFTGTATEIASSSGNTYVQITLQQPSVTQTFSSTSGGTVTLNNGSSVELPANAMVDKFGNAFTGNVSVSVAYLDPTDPKFGQLTQGSDMQAIEMDGDKVTLYSYGILRVELSDAAGNELQLASGKEATITAPIPTSMTATAPATIPLWYFDETTGIWKEEGQASKVGSQYIGKVEHFTDWNCDVPSPDQATISGTVLDCNNNSVPYSYVRVGQTYAITDANGKFIKTVPSGVDLECKVEAKNNQGLSSASYESSALSPGQEYDFGNIILITCPSYLTGTLKDCEDNPVTGWVQVSTDSYLNYVYSSNGAFKINVPNNTDVTVKAFSELGGYNTTIIASSTNVGDLTSLGSINVCASLISVGDNGFTIDGLGYTNQDISVQISNYTYNQLPNDEEFGIGCIWDSTALPDDDRIAITVKGKNNLNNSTFPSSQMYLYFYGTKTTYELTGSNEIYLRLVDNSGSWNLLKSDSGSITITRKDDAGGLIEGTFSGIFYNANGFDNTTPITITNGRFSVVRLPYHVNVW